MGASAIVQSRCATACCLFSYIPHGGQCNCTEPLCNGMLLVQLYSTWGPVQLYRAVVQRHVACSAIFHMETSAIVQSRCATACCLFSYIPHGNQCNCTEPLCNGMLLVQLYSAWK